MATARPSRSLLPLLLAGAAFAASLCPAPRAFAQATWDGQTNANWSTPTNWNPDGEPTLATAVSFGSPVPPTGSTITLSAGEQAFSLSFLESYTLTGGDLTLGAATSISVDPTFTATINSIVAGAGTSLAKTGDGTLVLTGANTFAGTLTLNAGVLRATTNAAALGTGALSLGGGELQLANDTALGFNRNTTVTGNTQITSDRLTAGAGVTHTLGTLSIGAQTLTVGAGSNVNSGTAGVTFGAVTLSGNAVINTNAGALTTLGAVTMGTNSLTIGGLGDTTITGSTGTTTSSAGAITKNDSGILRITADPNNTGQLTINGGVVELNHSGSTDFNTVINSGGTLRTITAATGDSADITVNAGGTYDYRVSDTIGGLSGAGTVTKGVAGAATLTVNNNNETTTFSGVIQNGLGTVTVAKNGTGTLTLTGANTYTGSTTILRGIVILDFSAGGAPASNILAAGSTLLFNSNTTTTSLGTVRMTGAASTVNSQAFTATTIQSGTNILELTSGTGGTLNVALGNITRSGSATLNILAPASGTITATNGNGLLGNWATYTSGGSTKLARVVSNTVVAATADFIYQTGVDIANVANYSATGIMQVDNTSTGQVLQGAGNTPLHSVYYTDSAARTFEIASGETLQFASSGTFLSDAGAGQATLGATVGTGSITAGTTGAADLMFHVVDVSGQVTVNSVIANNAGSGAVSVTKSGAGEVILTTANTYTGATTVTAGTLDVRNAGALGTGATGTTVLGGATLEISGGLVMTEVLNLTGGGVGAGGALRSVSGNNTYAATITFSGGSTIGADADTLTLDVASGNSITAGNNSLTFAGAGDIVVNDNITHGGSSNPGIVKNGTGTLFLTVANTLTGTGTFTINDGVVRITHGGALGTGATGATSVTDNASLEISGGITTDEHINMVNATGINASGAIHNIAGNNTITGIVTTDDGTSRIMADVGTQLTITGEFRGDPSSGSNRSATIGGDGTVVLAGVVRNGTGTTPGVLSLIKDGTGTLTMSAANTYTGTTAVNNGTLTLTGSITASAITVAAAGTFTESAAGVLSGTTSLTSAGTSTLGGANTHTGVTNVTGGTATLTGSVSATAITVGTSGTFNQTSAGVLAGTATLSSAGNTTLSGTNTTTGATAVTNGTLTLNYDTGAGGTNTSKLANGAALTLGGGTVVLSGGSHTEVVASTTLTAGTRSDISRSSGTSVLALNTVNPGAGAVVNFMGEDIASTANANVNGILGSWATITVAGETDFAMNSGVSDGVTGGGLIRAYNGYTDITRLGPASVVPDNGTLNVRIINGGTSGPITLASINTEINTLQMDASDGPATIDPGTTDVLMIGGETGGAILQTAASGGLTVGTASGDGRLTTGGTANTTPAGLHFINESTANALTINAIITNNGASNTDVVNIVKSGAGMLVLTGANTYTGGTRLEEGIIRATTNAGALSNSGTVTIVGGELQLANNSNLTFGRAVSILGSATFTSDRLAAGAGVTHSLAGLDLNANNTTLTFRKGSNVTSGTAGITFTGAFNTNGNAATIDVGSDVVMTMSGSNGTVADASSVLTKIGAGTWVISGANNFWEGPTIAIVQGTLDLRNANALGDNTPATQLITAADGTTLRLGIDTGSDFRTDLTLTGTGGTATLIADRSTAGAGNTHTMDSLNLGSNTLLIQRGSNVTSGTETVIFDAASTVGVGAAINATTADITISAAISGTGGSLTKLGAGQLTLSGVNTYTGPTTLSAGTLQIGLGGVGSLAASSALTVNGAGTVLAGTGTVNGLTTVTQGVIRPGDSGGASVGTLNLAGGLTTSPATPSVVAELQISGPSTSDLIHITGGLTLSSNSNITVLPSTYTAMLGDTFLLMDWTGLLMLNGWNTGLNFRDGSGDTGTNFDLPDISASGFIWDISTLVDGANGGSLRITVAAVPEPSRMLLLVGAFAGMILRRRRQR
ncbi:autotransporter-associated beta strand repeat-containing protein [Roseimicrobium sp. ORNL1]|uniref:autotransporter-associated beta strand repeat-containing protein n=1 Tax=Roseimicrobium sp. ORNL1 TaxID=2711231 RepID=UPI0013E1D29E|nr:autotransporter-associated beta strand repeat-containing protein [Roseimicrobium sp. ORNL1]QIF03490.1 PEP-CTERM sorting domain-containing protein [Roseimicrobium sp. ORNL1]